MFLAPMGRFSGENLMSSQSQKSARKPSPAFVQARGEARAAQRAAQYAAAAAHYAKHGAPQMAGRV